MKTSRYLLQEMARCCIVVIALCFVAILAACSDDSDDNKRGGNRVDTITVDCQPGTITAPASGGQYTIAVSTNGEEWGIYAVGEWMSLTPHNTAEQKGTIDVRVEANPTTSSRSGTITVKSGVGKFVVAVNQAAADIPTDDNPL